MNQADTVRRRIRVLIVDDSAIVRTVFNTELSREPDIEVVGTAGNPYEARDRIVELGPDVIALDVDMPGMDGITFLKKLMRYHPLPVIIVSSLTPAGGKRALEAMDAGAVEVMCKPGDSFAVSEMASVLADKIRAAAGVSLSALRARAPASTAPEPLTVLGSARRVVAIGASTGGPQAIEEILRRFPENAPPALIVQHMPQHFTRSFADRLNGLCRVRVREARNGDAVVSGVALVAPGNFHMMLRKRDSTLHVEIKDGPRLHRQKPSAEALFKSVAEAAGSNAVGVLLTGMGADGADGLLAMKEAGAHTIAQDEETCVVYGMPREAVRRGGVCEVLPLNRIAGSIIAHA